MRKKDETLRGTILDLAKEMIETGGVDSITIRSIANKAGIATGTVYNYFSSKDEILLALTEKFWKQTLQEMKQNIQCDEFDVAIAQIYDYLVHKINHMAGSLMRSLSSSKTIGYRKMMEMQMMLQNLILEQMNRDKRIQDTLWNDSFSQNEYTRFVVVNLVSQLQTRASNIDFLVQIIQKTLYEGGI